jgi:hypothetical protein
MTQLHPHTINGKKTTPGDSVHYTDQNGQAHAAIITGITDTKANLHVLYNDGATGHVKEVPHSADGAVHTWNHLPK